MWHAAVYPLGRRPQGRTGRQGEKKGGERGHRAARREGRPRASLSPVLIPGTHSPAPTLKNLFLEEPMGAARVNARRDTRTCDARTNSVCAFLREVSVIGEASAATLLSRFFRSVAAEDIFLLSKVRRMAIAASVQPDKIGRIEPALRSLVQVVFDAEKTPSPSVVRMDFNVYFDITLPRSIYCVTFLFLLVLAIDLIVRSQRSCIFDGQPASSDFNLYQDRLGDV